MGFTQSAEGKYLSAGLNYAGSDKQEIVSIDIHSGEIKTLYTGKSISHVQFNKYNKNLLRFSNHPQRMWYIDIREPGVARKLHLQEPGELVTHEDWWVNDQMTFCGAYRKEESHLKIIDLATQTTRIIGAGSWWPDKSPENWPNIIGGMRPVHVMVAGWRPITGMDISALRIAGLPICVCLRLITGLMVKLVLNTPMSAGRRIAKVWSLLPIRGEMPMSVLLF